MVHIDILTENGQFLSLCENNGLFM